MSDLEERVVRAEKILLLSNADRVGPEARHKLRGLLRYYGKKAHPFAACVRDNRKRFGPRAEAVCAVLKDLIRGTTRWRGKNNPNDHGTAGLTGLSEDELPEIDDEMYDLLMKISDEDYYAIEQALWES